MLTLLRVRRVARLRRRPEFDGAFRPLHRAGSLQPSFFGVRRSRLPVSWHYINKESDFDLSFETAMGIF
jgi:hypothetical protein